MALITSNLELMETIDVKPEIELFSGEERIIKAIDDGCQAKSGMGMCKCTFTEK